LAAFEKALGTAPQGEKATLPTAAPVAAAKPSSPEFVELALLHAGQAAGQMKKWDESLALLKRLLKDFPDSLHKSEAIYEEGSAEQNLGHAADALKLYETVAEGPESVAGARARFMMGEVLFDQGNHTEAIRNYYKVIYGYGDTQSPAAYHVWQANATFEAARCWEVRKSVDKAKKLYNELLSRYPDSDKAAAAKQRLAAIAG